MIHTFADLCTYVYVLVDERYRVVAAPYDHRPGPRSAFTDSEVITLTLVAELLGLDEETAFLAYLDRHHRALFPLLPERSRYNRRRRCLIEVTNRVRAGLMGDLLPHLQPAERDLCVIDSVPVPVVGFPHARGEHRWHGEAAYGYVASKRQTIFGYKLHLLITQGGLVLGRLTAAAAALCVIDSLPIPVVGFPHARGSHRWHGEASYGYVASRRQTIFGFMRHLLIAHSGLILAFALAPAHHADGALTEQLLLDKHRLTALGDKAYLNAALQALLTWRNELVLLTPKRANQREQLPAALTQAINHFRQAIETVNSQLAGQFQIERNWAKSISGLCARLQAKLPAHTLGRYLNCLLGQPLLALTALAVI